MLRAVRVPIARAVSRPTTSRVAARRFAKEESKPSAAAPKAPKAPKANPAGAAPATRPAATEKKSATVTKEKAQITPDAKKAPVAPAAKPAPAAEKAEKKAADKDKGDAAEAGKPEAKSSYASRKAEKDSKKAAIDKEEEAEEQAGKKKGSADAAAKRTERQIARKEREAEKKEETKKASQETPKDEIEDEGEFVPPKAEKMSPLEAADLIKRALATASRGADLLKAESYNEAESLIQTAWYQLKPFLPETHPRMLKLTMELAFIYQMHGRKDQALALYEKGAEHWSKMLGAQSKEYGSLLANWAELLATIGKHPEAEAKVKEALAVLNPLFPAEHELIGGLEANLASYQASQQKWDEAYSTATKALKILEKALGAGHDYTIFCLENLLKLLNDQGKTDTVEELKIIWGQKTKRPFRVLTQAEVEKLMPTDEEIAKIPEQAKPPSTPRSKSFTPSGKIVSTETFVAEMAAFWKKAQEKGLDANPAMQNVVLEDLVRARVISPQEKEAMLQRKREQLSQMIMEKIQSFTPEQAKLMVKQYLQVQEAVEEVSQWDEPGGLAIDVVTIEPEAAAQQTK